MNKKIDENENYKIETDPIIIVHSVCCLAASNLKPLVSALTSGTQFGRLELATMCLFYLFVPFCFAFAAVLFCFY